MLGIIAVIITMLVIIFMTRRGIRLEIVMLTGSLILALFSRMTPITAGRIAWNAIIDPNTIRLALIIVCITSLGHLMKITGCFDEMIGSLRAVVADLRILIVFIPALVGLLAVPGGAIMSAPLIKPLGDEIHLDRDSLAVANIMFRHLYSFLFPFSSGILVISSISGVEVMEFVKFNIPIILIILPFMVFYIFRSIKVEKVKKNHRFEFQTVTKLILSLFPFILVLFLGLGLKIYFPLALLSGILYIIFIRTLKPACAPPLHFMPFPLKPAQIQGFWDYLKRVKERTVIALQGIKWSMVLVIIGIMIFKDFIAISGFLNDISSLLLKAGIPLFSLALLFPLTTALMTGNNSAALGMSVPLFLPLVPAGTSGIPYYNLIYVCSIIGYMASPFHLCLILTTDYYKASFPKVIKYVAFLGSWILALALVRVLLFI